MWPDVLKCRWEHVVIDHLIFSFEHILLLQLPKALQSFPGFMRILLSSSPPPPPLFNPVLLLCLIL